MQLSLPFDFLPFTYIFVSSSVVCLVKIDLEFKAVYSGWIFLKPLEFQPVSKSPSTQAKLIPSSSSGNKVPETK